MSTIDMGSSMYAHDVATTTPRPRTSKPPVSPVLQEAMEKAEESLQYHEKRMGKRVRKLRGESSAFDDDEPATGVRCIPCVLPDPFPPEPRKV